MTVNDMRCFILNSYPKASKSFRNRVAFTMKPNQVIAIYHSILNRPRKKEEKEEPKEEFHQMDMFEWVARIEANSDVKGSHTEVKI